MTTIQSVQIILDNTSAVFQAGDIISGKVLITLNSPIKISGISIKFNGEANTLWTKEHTQKNGNIHTKVTTDYTANEEYFKYFYFLTGGQGGNAIDLSSGTHSYPFTFTLPPTLPSSFEGPYGHIRYTIKVSVDKYMQQSEETKMAFTIISSYDLNIIEEAKKPQKHQFNKTLGCCCWASWPVRVTASIPHTGFVSGQTIPVSTEVQNESSNDVEIHYLLNQIVTYHARTPESTSRTETQEIKEVEAANSIEYGDSKSWIENFIVPSLAPSDLTNCSIIDLKYELKVELVPEGFHLNKSRSFSIIIGTKPLNATIQPPKPNAIGWNISPPSYKESQYVRASSIQDSEDSDRTHYANGIQYSPSYPVYDFSKLPMPSAPNS